MEDFDKGAKRKCTSCSTLFFDFGKSPIICPNCGATVNTLLTNVSKRGRPPKATKEVVSVSEHKDEQQEVSEEQQIDTPVDEEVNIDSSDDDSVEEIIEISRDEE